MIAIRAIPVVVVEADGVALPPEEIRSLAEVRVRQGLSLPALCELTFGDPPLSATAVDRLGPGARLRLVLSERREALFDGQVTAVEYVYGPNRRREVHVRAYDLLHRLRKSQTVRAFQQVTVADLARELTASVGLQVQAIDEGPLWQTLIQSRQTDLDFLLDVAERCGLYLSVHDGVLQLVTLEGAGEDLPLILGESLLEARVEANGDPACRSVTVEGWDVLLAAPHRGQAGSPRSGRSVDFEVAPGTLGATGERVLIDVGAPADPNAEAIAQAELDRCIAREVVLWGIADGDPRIRPGARVSITGVDERFAGRYVVNEVTHVVDGRTGFISEFSTSPPLPRPRERGAVVSLGLVTRVDDPDRLGRVKVTLPTFGDVETDWMGVLTAAAGPNKGFVALPDVGDHVLVLFAHGDPVQGIVLGGLYGAQGPPDSGVDGGAVRRYTLQTPGGQHVQLDDHRQSIRLEDRSGSYVDLSPDLLRVHAAVDLEIEAPGRSVLIRGRSIDFESG